MNPIVRESMSALVIQPSFRALGQMQVKWQTFEKPENKRQMKRQMYGSQAWVALPYICLLFSFFSNVCHSAAFWPTALLLGCITNFDMLFLMMGLISLVTEIQFMLISSHHFSNRSIHTSYRCFLNKDLKLFHYFKYTLPRFTLTCLTHQTYACGAVGDFFHVSFISLGCK